MDLNICVNIQEDRYFSVKNDMIKPHTGKKNISMGNKKLIVIVFYTFTSVKKHRKSLNRTLSRYWVGTLSGMELLGWNSF